MDATPFHIDLQEAGYLRFMERLHTILQPETYLEIGTRTGDSLKLASCASIAIDPSFDVSDNVLGAKPACHFYQMTSDRFFRKHSPESVLGGKIDMAFLDGMHLAEFLLRDFINVERCCRRNSVILMHDCMPSDIHMACRREGDHAARGRSVSPGWWTGDVWKAVWALVKYRADLRIHAIDSPPTGLVCITNLDPQSTVLERDYAPIVQSMTALGDSDDHLQRFLASIRPIKPSRIETLEDVAAYFFT